MLVRLFWPDCQFWRWTLREDGEVGDAFWVEATLAEAREEVFPWLSEEDREHSEDLVRKDGDRLARKGEPGRPFCFLVTRDLGRITPCSVIDPCHQMWGAYSPFVPMPPRKVWTLAELAEIEVPDHPRETEG
jgi:hypothetical protein